MTETSAQIPTEVYLDFLGQTIQIHWNYHAILMVAIWMFLVPLCLISLRYFKPRPTKVGIQRKISTSHAEWNWFSSHKFGLYLAMLLSLGGMVVALVVSQKFSGSVHAIFGLLTIFLGCLQIVSSLLRGTHGGKYYYTADASDPKSWDGDHYNMSPRRRWFESYHRPAGYFTLFCAIGAIASGLMQFWMPVLFAIILLGFAAMFIVVIVFEYNGKHYDTYRAVFGNDPENPHNMNRKDL